MIKTIKKIFLVGFISLGGFFAFSQAATSMVSTQQIYKQETEEDLKKGFTDTIQFISDDTKNPGSLDKQQLKFDLQILKGSYYILSQESKQQYKEIYETYKIYLFTLLATYFPSDAVNFLD